MNFFLAVISHPFLTALALMAIIVIATMIADYFHNGAGLEELAAMVRARKGELILTLLVVYSLAYLIVNSICLGADFILNHA